MASMVGTGTTFAHEYILPRVFLVMPVSWETYVYKWYHCARVLDFYEYAFFTHYLHLLLNLVGFFTEVPLLPTLWAAGSFPSERSKSI